MLNLSQKTLIKVKNVLLRKQKEVAQQLKDIERSDPVLVDGPSESAESGTDSWLADAHHRLVAVKNDLLDFSGKISKSLLRIKKGTYGKCERCKKPIEAERLEALPTATFCVACSKKLTKKKSFK